MLHLQNVSPQAGWTTTSPLACTTFVLYLYSSFFSARLWLIALQIATIAEDDLSRGTGQLFLQGSPAHQILTPTWSSTTTEVKQTRSHIFLHSSAPVKRFSCFPSNRAYLIPEQVISDGWSITQLSQGVTGNAEKKRVLQVYLIVNHNCKKTQLSIQREHTIPIMLPHSYAKLCPHSHWFNSMTSGSASTSDSPGPTAGSEPSPVVSKAPVLALACYFFSHFLTTHTASSRSRLHHWSRQQYKDELITV